MKWWDLMPWSSFSECWALSQLFHSPPSLSSRGFLVPLHFLSDYTEAQRRCVSGHCIYSVQSLHWCYSFVQSLALLPFSLCNHIPSSPSGLWVCGRNKGTGTETSENVVISVHQSGWLWWWKAAFHRKRYLNQQKNRAWTWWNDI